MRCLVSSVDPSHLYHQLRLAGACMLLCQLLLGMSTLASALALIQGCCSTCSSVMRESTSFTRSCGVAARSGHGVSVMMTWHDYEA